MKDPTDWIAYLEATPHTEPYMSIAKAWRQQVEGLRSDLTACQLERDRLKNGVRALPCTHWSGPMGSGDNGTAGYCIDVKSCTCDLAGLLQPRPENAK